MPIDLTYAEQFGVVVGGLASLIVAVGGVAVVRGRKETSEGEGPSQIAVLKKATDENTGAMKRNSIAVERASGQLQHINETLAEIKRGTQEGVLVVKAIERVLFEMNVKKH